MATTTRKVLRIGIDSPVRQMYPRVSDGYTAQLVCRQIFEPPFEAPIAGRSSRPLLFAGHLTEESNRNGIQILSARIRDDLRFSDGTPVSPSHVAESLAALEQENQAEVTTQGERILFVLRRPNANFHLALTQTYWALGLEHGNKMLGTGAFRLVPESSPERVILERNPYYRAEVPLDGIEFLVYPPEQDGSKTALVEALERGDVDLTTTLGQRDVSSLRKLRKWFDPGSSTCNLYFNTAQTPMNDAGIRRAIALGINRLDLSAAVYGNALAFAAKGPLPPVMGEWLDGFSYDVDAANQQLDELGVKRPLTMRLLMPWAPRPYVPNPRVIASQLEDMFARLRIELDLIPTRDLLDFRRHVIQGEYDLALLGWNADTPDPADFLETSLASDAIPEQEDSPVVKANWSRWASPQMDAALAAFRADPEDNTRSNRTDILKLLTDEAPMLPLIHGPTLCVHSFRVRNFEPNPFGIPSLADVDLWL